MNKFKMNNNRLPGNAPGKFVDEENSLNVADLSGNQLTNESGFEGGSSTEMASFARNANVTTPTNTTEVGFGSARQSNPDGGGQESGQQGRQVTTSGKTNLTASQKFARANKLKSLKSRFNFKNNKVSKIDKSFALDKGNIKGASNAMKANANTNKLSS